MKKKLQLSPGILREWLQGPPTVPKSKDAQVLYRTLCRICTSTMSILLYTLNHLQITQNTCVCVCVCVSCSVVFDSFRPHGLWPARLFCPWDSPGKNIGAGCHFLLQGGDLFDPGIKPGSPALQADSLLSEPPGKPCCCCCCYVTLVVSDSVRPHRRQPIRLPVPGILQARTLEWVAISFSNA